MPLQDIDLSVISKHLEIIVILTVPSIQHAHHIGSFMIHDKMKRSLVRLIPGISLYFNYFALPFSLHNTLFSLRLSGFCLPAGLLAGGVWDSLKTRIFRINSPPPFGAVRFAVCMANIQLYRLPSGAADCREGRLHLRSRCGVEKSAVPSLLTQSL